MSGRDVTEKKRVAIAKAAGKTGVIILMAKRRAGEKRTAPAVTCRRAIPLLPKPNLSGASTTKNKSERFATIVAKAARTLVPPFSIRHAATISETVSARGIKRYPVLSATLRAVQAIQVRGPFATRQLPISTLRVAQASPKVKMSAPG